MGVSDIRFASKDVPFQVKKILDLRKWIASTVAAENQSVASVQYVWCSDEALWEINTKFLAHDTYTDIITFDYRESPEEPIRSDLYISVERVKENAAESGTAFIDELHRVMIHGILHLCGYGDNTPAEKAEMTEKEDYYLSLRTF